MRAYVRSSRVFAAIAGIILVFCSTPGTVVPMARADTGTLSFSGTLLAGTCDLTVNNNTNLVITTVESKDFVGKTWPHTTPQAVTFKLSNCGGLSGNLTPNVHLESGTLVTMTGGTGTNQYIFGDNTGSAKNIGVAIISNPNTSLGTNCSLCVKTGGLVWADPKNTPLYSSDHTFTVNVAATCGTWCDGMTPGTFKGAVTFRFYYN